MATRTTETAVREIIKTALTAPQVKAFIADANLWVTEELVDGGAGLSAARLEIIERYLACALIRVRDLGLKNATIENVSESYQVDATVSEYLLHAASFDPSGRVRMQFLPSQQAVGVRRVLARVGTGFRTDRIRRVSEVEE